MDTAPFTNRALMGLWINNHIHWFVWDVITNPFPNFSGLAKPLLRLGHIIVVAYNLSESNYRYMS